MLLFGLIGATETMQIWLGKQFIIKFFLFKSQVKNGWNLSQLSQVVLPLGPVSVSDSGLNQKPCFGPRLQYVCEIVNN